MAAFNTLTPKCWHILTLLFCPPNADTLTYSGISRKQHCTSNQPWHFKGSLLRVFKESYSLLPMNKPQIKGCHIYMGLIQGLFEIKGNFRGNQKCLNYFKMLQTSGVKTAKSTSCIDAIAFNGECDQWIEEKNVTGKLCVWNIAREICH